MGSLNDNKLALQAVRQGSQSTKTDNERVSSKLSVQQSGVGHSSKEVSSQSAEHQDCPVAANSEQDLDGGQESADSGYNDEEEVPKLGPSSGDGGGPAVREGACGGVIGGLLYMWGGCSSDHGFHYDSDSVDIFDPTNEEWTKVPSHGSSPPPLCYPASAVSNHCLYVYGGRGENQVLMGSLYQYDTWSSTWTLLSGSGQLEGPQRKCGSGMVQFGANKLVLFGGWCAGMQYSNEQHVFDIRTTKWSVSEVTGTRPPPLAYFTFTKISDNQVILLGGYMYATPHDHLLYFLKLDTMNWCRVNLIMAGAWRHTAVCLGYGGPSPQLLVAGGRQCVFEMLDVKRLQWSQLSLKVDREVFDRSGFMTGAFSLNSGLTKVIVFGGDYGCSSGTTLLVFGVQSLSELCSSVIKSALQQHQHTTETGLDELVARLPDYVPPRIKRYITHDIKSSVERYKVWKLQL